MTAELSPEDQRQHTLRAVQAAGLTIQEIWIHYFSICGDVDEFELDAYLHGLILLAPLDRDLLSQAVNELIAQSPPPTAPYSDDL